MFKKVKVIFLLLVLVSTLFITGCLTASLGPKFTQAVVPESGKAVIYVYRQRGVMTAQELPGVKINDVEVVSSLPEIIYFSLSVEPGQYTFTPKKFGIYKTTEATIDAQAGQVYYIRLKVSIGNIAFDEMKKEEATAYMATCYQLDPKYSRDPRVMTGKQISQTNTVTRTTPEVSEPVAGIEETTDSVPAETVEKVGKPSKPSVKKDPRGSLYVNTNPSEAKIRIMNIAPVFKQGIRLKADRYDVEVSAPGYLSYREWIDLQKEEEKHLQVVLKPEQKKVVPQKRPIVQEQKTAAPVKTVKKIVAPSNLSPEEKRFGKMLQSDSLANIRNAAKYIYRRYYESDYLTSLAEQALLKHYSGDSSNLRIDAMAWLCKVLGRTGDNRFADTLRTVARNAPHRKLRGYAQKSLSQL